MLDGINAHGREQRRELESRRQYDNDECARRAASSSSSSSSVNEQQSRRALDVWYALRCEMVPRKYLQCAQHTQAIALAAVVTYLDNNS